MVMFEKLLKIVDDGGMMSEVKIEAAGDDRAVSVRLYLLQKLRPADEETDLTEFAGPDDLEREIVEAVGHVTDHGMSQESRETTDEGAIYYYVHSSECSGGDCEIGSA